MKNFLIILLLAGLAVSVYFNFKKCNAPVSKDIKTIEIGKDSLRISFFSKPAPPSGNDSIPPKAPGTDPVFEGSIMVGTGPCEGKEGDDLITCLRGGTCCPTPPNDTTKYPAAPGVNVTRLAGLNIQLIHHRKK